MRGFNRRREAKDVDSAAQVLELAQQTADQAIADAQREAEKILDRARLEAQQIIADARTRAQTDTTAGPRTRQASPEAERQRSDDSLKPGSSYPR
jgi:F0F1-type ATP synthase membrane subunit b/b'